MLQFLWLVPLGYMVGAFGTLIGAGGGFILVPIMLLIYPDKSAETITSISLAVVFFNALSGTSAYARMKKIDFKSGVIFSLATVPGSILGAITTSYIPRRLFNGVFGVVIIIVSIYLLFRKNQEKSALEEIPKHFVTRNIVDAEDKSYVYSYNPVIGIVLSVFVGYLSSLLGIGGGIIHVPALVNLLNFPIHIATATSHFILVIASFTGSVIHLVNGDLAPGIYQIIALSIGVIFGAQLGAKLSKKIHGKWIIRSLAIALLMVGIRIFIMAL